MNKFFKITIRKKKKDTFDTLLGAVELGKLICQNLFTKNAIHSDKTMPLATLQLKKNVKQKE